MSIPDRNSKPEEFLKVGDDIWFSSISPQDSSTVPGYFLRDGRECVEVSGHFTSARNSVRRMADLALNRSTLAYYDKATVSTCVSLESDKSVFFGQNHQHFQFSFNFQF